MSDREVRGTARRGDAGASGRLSSTANRAKADSVPDTAEGATVPRRTRRRTGQTQSAEPAVRVERRTKPKSSRAIESESEASTSRETAEIETEAEEQKEVSQTTTQKAPSDGMHTMDGRPAEPHDRPARPVSRNLDPSQLYRGRARMALLRDLAMGEWSDSSIASSVGVPVEIIADFRETYENEIAEVRAALAGQLAIESAGLWISKKHNRISELQADYEDIDLVIDVMRKNTKFKLSTDGIKTGSDSMVKGDTFDTDMLLGSRRHQNLLRAKISVLKAVADEYAPSKNKKEDTAESDANQIRYVIEQDEGNDILEALS